MAQKEVRYFREYNTQRDSGNVKIYDTLEAAIADRNPVLNTFVYEIKPKLLGEIKWTLVPIGSDNKATTVKVTLESPKDKKK